MECHATREQEEEDGDGEFLARAEEDIAVVAKLLIWLSRSKTFGSSVPVSELSAPPPRRTQTAPAPPRMPRPEEEEEEKADKRASPTTPLSWSGRSAALGALCDDGWSAPSPPPKRRQKTTAHLRGDPVLLPRSSPRSTPAAARSPAVFRSNKDVVMAAAAAAAADGLRTPSKVSATVEPFRLTSTCPSSVGDRRQGKKKTVMELRAMKDFLLQEQAELRKELARQEEIYSVLLEENSSLKKLESSGPPPKVSVSPVDPGEVNTERTQPGPAPEYEGGRRTRPTPPPPAVSFPFDLNRSPDDEI